MRSFNGHHMANFKGSHSISVSPREQVEIYAASTQILTLSGEVEKIEPKLDDKGKQLLDKEHKPLTVIKKYSVILNTGTLIDLKAIYHNFVCLRVSSPSPTVKFGLMVKTSARQLQEPHDPTKISLFESLPETEETTLQRMVKRVQGYSSEIQKDGNLSDQRSRGTMEPENFPFDSYVLDDSDPDIFDEPQPPQDAHIPKATDPAVQPQGIQPTAAEPQPSPPTNEPQSNDKGQ